MKAQKPIRRTRRKRSKRSASQHRMVLALDAACRARVFARDMVHPWAVPQCQRCGNSTDLQWSHVHSRRHYCLRWDDDNSEVLCVRCHCWWTNNPGLAFDWFSKKWPERWERITRVLIANPKVHVKDLYQELQSSKRIGVSG